jgi:hypothetical protein
VPNWQKWTFGVLLLAVGAVVGMVAFGGGVSDGEHDALVLDLEAAEAELSVAQGDLGALAAERDAVQAELDAARDEIARAGGPGDFAALEAQVAGLESQMAALQVQSDEQSDLVSDLQRELRTERQAREAAEGTAADLVTAYDAELAASRVTLIGSIGADICRLHPDDPVSRESLVAAVRAFVDGSPEYSVAFAGYDVATTFDVVALEAIVAECQRVEQEVAPKGDGFYLVGFEIAPGLWHSTGSGEGCFWARRDQNQVAVDNFFGFAGGTVNVLETDFEIEFDGCGIFEYLGPVPVVEEEEKEEDKTS